MDTRFSINSIDSKIYMSTLKPSLNMRIDSFGTSISSIGSREYDECSVGELDLPVVNSDTDNNKNDSIKDIVDSLVMSRFGGTFKNTLERMSFRKSGRRSNSSGIFSNSSNYSNSSDDLDVNCCSLCDKSEEKLQSDCSINTTNLSHLLSNCYQSDLIKPSCPDREPYYCNIDEFSQEAFEKLDSSIDSNRECVREIETENLTYRDFREDIYRLSVQIEQILKTVDRIKCLNFNNQRLEAEVALLIALHRLELLRSSFLSPSTRPQNELPVSTVTINNISILTNIPKMEGFSQYFIGVFSYGTDLIKTEVVRKSDQGNFVNIKGPWVFNKLTTDFNINLKIYCLNVEKEKSVFRRYFQRMPNFICHRPAFQMAPSMFEYLGQIDIVTTTLGCGNIRPLYRSPFAYAECWISIDSKAHLNIEMNQSGFLDVAKVSSNSCPLWNHRWCILDDTRLMFWNYPRERDFHHVPFDIIDLKNCQKFRIATREECCRNRTLLLEIYTDNNENVSYLLSVESQQEFNKWQNCLNLVMNTLQNWRQFQIYPRRQD